MNPLPINSYSIKVLGRNGRIIYESSIYATTRKDAIRKLLKEYQFDYGIEKNELVTITLW